MLTQNQWLKRMGVIAIATIIAVLVITRTNAQQVTESHPLAPLTESEIVTAVSVVKKEKSLTDQVAFPNLSLKEPDKQKVLNFKPGDAFEREAFVVVLEPKQNTTYEGVVNLKKAAIVSWREIPNVQPALLDADYELLTELAKADPRWQAAMKKRGITDWENAIVDGWAPGMLSEAERASGKRLIRGVTYYKDQKRMNYYGSPIEGLMIVVDLNDKKVFDVVDYGVKPVSKANFDYDLASVGHLQAAPKALQIKQPNGTTFKIKGNEVTWQNWKFRYLMHPREGLTLYQVSYNDNGVERPILYRAGLSEMVVPYAETTPTWAVRSAFDVGEYRFGWLSTPLVKGSDVPENAVLLNALFADDAGKPSKSEGVIALYERDAGILWRHYDFDAETFEGRRSRELVLTTIAAIGNYDYAIHWIFHEDGSIEEQTDLTGIMLVKGTEDVTETDRSFGHLVAPNVVAVNHQHFLNFRLDFDVDGPDNSVMEMKVSALPEGPNNPYANAFKMEEKHLMRESEAVRDLNMAESRSWMVMNSQKKNAVGSPVGYMLMPGANSIFYPSENSNMRQRGQFATHHFWATRYNPDELYAGGDYPNQSLPDRGLPQWIANNESLDGEDVVVWYTMGVTHIPRPEEWPIMTIHRAGFKIMSRGFFGQNPVLNVPSSESAS